MKHWDRYVSGAAVVVVLLYVVAWFVAMAVVNEIEQTGLQPIVEKIWCGKDGCDS